MAGRPTFGRSRSVVVSHVVWCVLQLVRCIGVPRVVLKVFNGLGALDLLRSAIRCAVQLHTRVRAAWWDTTPWCDTIPRRGAIPPRTQHWGGWLQPGVAYHDRAPARIRIGASVRRWDGPSGSGPHDFAAFVDVCGRGAEAADDHLCARQALVLLGRTVHAVRCMLHIARSGTWQVASCKSLSGCSGHTPFTPR